MAGTEVIVAGHICLDVIPDLPSGSGGFGFRPGTLTEIGPVTIATGGCVSNTGQALHRLGVGTRLVCKVGNDPFGWLVRETLTRVSPALVDGVIVADGEQTSYSIILSPPGEDRMILHDPGANDTFTSGDVPDSALAEGRLFHFGYPPLMREMYADGGAHLAALLRRAQAAGLTTGVDMAYPDPGGRAAHVDWRDILTNALPFVDVFAPSLGEVLLMMEPQVARALMGRGEAALAEMPLARISLLATTLIGMGAAIVALKLGERGLYLRTAGVERLQRAGRGMPDNLAEWADRELWSPIFETQVVGTNGAGDATVAGLLLGLVRGMSPEGALTAACAVGASSVEAADATSGVRGWEETRLRIAGGWRRRDAPAVDGWNANASDGVRRGPSDRRPAITGQQRGEA
ncbi:MAG TPA: carbohydrate kinase family protein [Ktedonobacterales bacterium]